MNDDDVKDDGNVTIIGHIHIRDPDSGITILKKRDIQPQDIRNEDETG